MERILLLVDKDKDVLNAFKSIVDSNICQLITTTSGKEALELIQTTDLHSKIGVIVANDDLLDMTGLDLLHNVKSTAVETVRILLASESDAVCIMSAVNKGELYRILIKPWNDQDLVNVIEEAFLKYELMYENKRLTNELEQANEELKELNCELEERVKEKLEQLIQAVNYDALTGLPSRNLVHDQLDHAITYAKRANEVITVLYIGLDNFKLINESMGHNTGDELLMMVAERLSVHIRSCDSLARIGGDEFFIILTDIKVGGFRAQVDEEANSILDLLAMPFTLNNREIFLTASIGISAYPANAKSAEMLLANSESAMHKAKAENKNSYLYHSGKLNRFAYKRLALESELRQAIDKQEFMLQYQPRVNTESGGVVGVEALVRWNHPQKGLLLPDEFLPYLEETGLIQTVGDWILEKACQAIVRWSDAGLTPINMAVNLSAKQFHDKHFLQRVHQILKETGANHLTAQLEFEITESILMKNVQTTKSTLQSLHKMGIKLAIDDFGTGYSSLSYLIQFPLHYLKVDKTFVTSIDSNDDAKAIVEAIISLAYSIKLDVIAEGIETIEQLHALQSLACKEFQGFLFSEPLEEKEVVNILKADKQLSLIPGAKAYENIFPLLDTKH